MSDFDVFAERAHALDRAMRSQLDEALLTAARWDEAQRLITEHRARQSSRTRRDRGRRQSQASSNYPAFPESSRVNAGNVTPSASYSYAPPAGWTPDEQPNRAQRRAAKKRARNKHR